MQAAQVCALLLATVSRAIVRGAVVDVKFLTCLNVALGIDAQLSAALFSYDVSVKPTARFVDSCKRDWHAPGAGNLCAGCALGVKCERISSRMPQCKVIKDMGAWAPRKRPARVLHPASEGLRCRWGR